MSGTYKKKATKAPNYFLGKKKLKKKEGKEEKKGFKGRETCSR